MNIPTEYFGPHAKRWTNPDTGETISLSPRDYDRMVRQGDMRVQAKAIADTYGVPVVKHSDWPNQAIAAADEEWKAVTNGEGVVHDESWPHVITSDRLNITEEESALFKNRGVLIMPPSGWNPPEHQRYEMEVESSPIPAEMADRYDAIVYGATRGGIKYPTPEESVAKAQAAADAAFVAARIAEDARDGALADAGLPRYLSMAGDDSVCLIRPVEQTAPGEPAARHFRRRPSARNIARLALVYIIAVIGVISVAGVVF